MQIRKCGTNAAGETATTEYDLAGRPISKTDAKDNTSYTYYDKLDRIIRQTSPFDGERSAETKTYYDKNSNVVKTAVKQDDNSYQIQEFAYDSVATFLQPSQMTEHVIM